jgi:GDPmannose 4,6-dehydratase
MRKINKTALILGVSGQDGAYLARHLLSVGYKVHGSSRDHEINSFSNLERLGIKERVNLHSLSPADFRSVMTVLRKINPDEIYSLGGQTSVGLSFAYPVETFESITFGTINLLECLRLLGRPVKLYHASSSECFGDTKKPATEKTPFCPRSPYAVAKSAAHHAVVNYREAYGLFACCGVLFNHESPLRPERFVTQKIVSAARRIAQGSGEKLRLGNLNIQRDWGWAPEYVIAMWKMLQIKQPEDFVICTGKSHSLEDFTARVFGKLGLNWKNHVIHDERLKRPSDLQFSRGCSRQARNKLHWKPNVSFDQLVEKLVLGELH